MMCPQEIVPSMIGRGGETVGMMEKEAGAKIVRNKNNNKLLIFSTRIKNELSSIWVLKHNIINKKALNYVNFGIK